MPVFTEFKFKGTGTDPEDAEQTCTLNVTDPLVPKLVIGTTQIAVTLSDEFEAMLDAVDAEDTSDGVDPDALRLGRKTANPVVVATSFDDTDPLDIKRYVQPPSQGTKWSMSKARDFVAGAIVVRNGLGI